MLFGITTCPGYGQETFLAFGTESVQSGNLYVFDNQLYLIGNNALSGNADVFISKLDANLEILWTRMYGTNQSDQVSNAIQLSNGNLLIATGDGGLSFLLLEIDTNGNLIQSKSFETFTGSRGPSILLNTRDNGFLYNTQRGTANAGHRFAALMKFDENFNVQWRYYYDHRVSDDVSTNYLMTTMKSLQLADGSYMVLGNYVEINNSQNNRRIRLIKIDEEGNEQWVKGFHGGRMDFAFDIIQTQDGGFLILSFSNSYSDPTQILLTKVTAEGNL